MLMYLYGADSYRRSRALHEKIIAPFTSKYPDASVARFSFAQEEDITALREFVSTGSLFSKSRLCIATDLDEDSKAAKEICKAALKDSAVTIVVIAQKKLPKEFDFLLKEPVKSYEFEPLKDKEFVAFLTKEAAARTLKISKEDIAVIAQQYDGNTWAGITELEKIASGAVVEQFVKAPDFFPLIMKFKSGRTEGEKLRALSYLLSGSDPALIFNMVASMAEGGAKQRFAQYDIAIKSGKLEYEEALLDFILS